MTKIYPKGLITKTPSAKAPDFVVANLSIKNAEFAQFIHENGKNGWTNISVLRGRDGSLYSVLDEFEPKKSQTVSEIKEDIRETLSEEDDSENLADTIPF